MKSIKVLQWAWMVEEAFLIAFGAVLCLWGSEPQRVFFLAYLAPVQLMIGAQGAVAFGGPQLDKYQSSRGSA